MNESPMILSPGRSCPGLIEAGNRASTGASCECISPGRSCPGLIEAEPRIVVDLRITGIISGAKLPRPH